MQIRAHSSAKNRRIVSRVSGSKSVHVVRDFIPASEMPRQIAAWISDNTAAGHSHSRIETTTGITNRLVWFMLLAVAFA